MSEPLTVEQQFLVSPGESFVSELEKVVEVIAGKYDDPGFLQPASKRVAMVVAYLESFDSVEARANELCSSRMSRIDNAIAFKPGDPGKLYPTHERVIAVIAELEKRLANATMTLEAIGRAEGV